MACTEIDVARRQESVDGASGSPVFEWLAHAVWMLFLLGIFEWTLSAISESLLAH